VAGVQSEESVVWAGWDEPDSHRRPGQEKGHRDHNVNVGDKVLIRKETIFTKSSQITMQATQKPKFKQREETK
jgi:hypothetical protein